MSSFNRNCCFSTQLKSKLRSGIEMLNRSQTSKHNHLQHDMLFVISTRAISSWHQGCVNLVSYLAWVHADLGTATRALLHRWELHCCFVSLLPPFSFTYFSRIALCIVGILRIALLKQIMWLWYSQILEFIMSKSHSCDQKCSCSTTDEPNKRS